MERGGSFTFPKNPESVVEPIEDLLDRQRLETNSRQLDGQGDAVQSPTKLRGGLPLGCVPLQALKYRSGAGNQQIDGLALDGPLLGDGKGWDAKYGLAGDSQGLSARGEHLEMRAGPQQRVDEEGTAVQHVLAVVEEE